MADAYLKVKDNNGTLSLIREEADGSFTDLKNALNYFENGKHLFTYEIIPNSYPDANGVFQPFNNWDRTDYIEVKGGQRIYFNNTLGQTNDNAWYDENKTFISRFSIVVGSPTYADAPSNAKYMVISNQRIKWFGDIYTIQDYYATSVDLQRLCYRYVAKLDDALFEHGSLTSGKDSTYNEGSRARTPIICNDADITIKTHGGTERILIQTFTADGTYSGQLGWYESIVIPRGTIFRLLLTTNTTSSATVSIADILACFDIVYSDPWSDRPEAVDLFEKGSLTSADGQNSTWNADARARTKSVWVNDYDLEISTKNGAFIIYYYNSDNSFAMKSPDNPTTWYYNKTYVIPAGMKFRILVSLDPTSSSDIALGTILAGFTFRKIESRYANAIQKIYSLKRHFNTDESTVGTWTAHNNNSLFTLAHISDVHADTVRYQNFYNFYKANADIIDAAIQTGDLVDSPTDQQFAAMHAIDPNNDIIYCTGNHDISGNDGSAVVWTTKANIYSKMGLSTNTGELYHYVDFSDKKIRLIVLNDYDVDNSGANWNYQTAQLNWLVTTLKSAASSDLGVLIAMHLPESNITANTKGFYTRFYQWDGLESPDYGTYTAIEDIVDAFTRGTSVTTTAKSGSFTANFSGSAGTFIAYLTGHRHQDTTGYSATHSGQLYLNIVNGALNMDYGRKGRDFSTVSDLPRVEGQDCENAFNVYSFDLDNRIVKVLRVGADVNDLMEDRVKAVYTF